MNERMCQVWVLNKNQDEPNKSGQPMPQREAMARLAELKGTPGVRTAWLDDGTPMTWTVVVIYKHKKHEQNYSDKGPWGEKEARKWLRLAQREPLVTRAWLEPR